jgi:hypothetical protein
MQAECISEYLIYYPNNDWFHRCGSSAMMLMPTANHSLARHWALVLHQLPVYSATRQYGWRSGWGWVSREREGIECAAS